MSKINETNYPRRTQASYEDTDMLVIQEAGGNTYTTRLSDMRDDYQETLEPALEDMRDDINGNLATVEGSTASKIYHEGDYLVFNGVLCKVTATVISVGATLNIGTNIERAPVGDGLASLNSDLTTVHSISSTSNCQVLAGGYVKMGRVVVVSISCKVLNPIGFNDGMIAGFPPSLGDTAGPFLLGSNASTGTAFHAWAGFNGQIVFGDYGQTLSANQYISLAGAYISAS